MSAPSYCTGWCNGNGCGLTMCPGTRYYESSWVTPLLSLAAPPFGWQCPICGVVYAPTVQRCWKTHELADPPAVAVPDVAGEEPRP